MSNMRYFIMSIILSSIYITITHDFPDFAKNDVFENLIAEFALQRRQQPCVAFRFVVYNQYFIEIVLFSTKLHKFSIRLKNLPASFLYGAFSPTAGDDFMLEFPGCDTECFRGRAIDYTA